MGILSKVTEVGGREGGRREKWEYWKAVRIRQQGLGGGKWRKESVSGGNVREGWKGRIYSALLHLQLALVALTGREELYRHLHTSV